MSRLNIPIKVVGVWDTVGITHPYLLNSGNLPDHQRPRVFRNTSDRVA